MTVSTNDPVVDCLELTVKYGEALAVDRVTFDVGAGEVFGLLGPNGAGKTSVIRALTTIVQPAGGTATVGGHGLDRPHDVRGAIGVLPESGGYPTTRSAIEYLVFHGELFGLPRSVARSRGESLLRQLGLEGNTHQRIGTFSRGMRQRLGIARSLINRPVVLFLDEPTLGLDPAGREDVLGYLSMAARSTNTSVVLCSHLLDDVERICDRVAIMHEGRLVAKGSVAAVVRDAGLASGVRVGVTAADAEKARSAIVALPSVASVTADPARLGELDVVLSGDGDVNRVAAALIQDEVTIRSLVLRGARLSDAFLELTGAGRRPGDEGVETMLEEAR